MQIRSRHRVAVQLGVLHLRDLAWCTAGAQEAQQRQQAQQEWQGRKRMRAKDTATRTKSREQPQNLNQLTQKPRKSTHIREGSKSSGITECSRGAGDEFGGIHLQGREDSKPRPYTTSSISNPRRGAQVRTLVPFVALRVLIRAKPYQIACN